MPTVNRDVGGVQFATGMQTFQAITNVHDTAPTQAEMVTAFGSAAVAGAGALRTIKDADANTNMYICASNGTSWFYAAKLVKGA